MSQLVELQKIGAVGALDVHFAGMLRCRVGVDDERVLVAAALASRAPSSGDVCIDLCAVVQQLERQVAVHHEGDEPPAIPELWDPEPWRDALLAVPDLVRQADEPRRTPLVLDDFRVYIDSFRAHEDVLVAAVRKRAGQLYADVDLDLLREDLEALFDVGDPRQHRGRLAAATAVLRRLTVIHGGPGTGKTTVVAKLLSLLNRQARQQGKPRPRVSLVAPTGKAQARLSEAIRASVEAHIPEGYRAVETDASTIHRCLRWTPRTDAFSYNSTNRLPVDVMVVDEASMVDLPLMARLFSAVPDAARLILLGDPDQLVSVEAGAVLGDICKAGKGPRSRTMAEALAIAGVDLHEGDNAVGDEPRLSDCLVGLNFSWRFVKTPAIGDLAAAINSAKPDEVHDILADDDTYPEVSRLQLVEPDRHGALVRTIGKIVVGGYRPILKATDPHQALAALRTFRVLCAHRRGWLGADAVNRRIEQWLATAGLIKIDEDNPWYLHRPVMVTRNDDRLKLYNGDVGIVLPDADDPERRRVYFDSVEGSGEPRSFLPGAIPEHETVFATTVHKAQGSEYDHVVVVLHERVLTAGTQELLYTAVTRAMVQVVIVGSEMVIEQGISEAVMRHSGIRTRLTK